VRVFLNILLILSFLSPSLHFIGHSHIYNPFSGKLEHLRVSENTEREVFSYESFYKNGNTDKFDICRVKFFNNFFVFYYNSPADNTDFYINYAYRFNLLHTDTKNNIILKAPKNSPPLYS